jgi:hypothetical protein
MKVTKVEALKAALDGRTIKCPKGNHIIWNKEDFVYVSDASDVVAPSIHLDDGWEIYKEPVKWAAVSYVTKIPKNVLELVSELTLPFSKSSIKLIRVTVEEIID